MASSSRQKANGVAFPAEMPSKRSTLNTQMASSSRQKGKGVAFPVETMRKRRSLNTQMASTSRQKGKSVTLPVETPGFFKVVLDYALQGGRLKLEGFVASKFGNFLSDKLLLKAPNGEVWPIELTRDDVNDSLWLEKGWPEFAKFYSLENGCFLFFSYEGISSCLKVRIFNKHGLEVAYFFRSSHDEEPNLCTAFSRASRFLSNRPYFSVKLQRSYIVRPLNMPSSFANQYILQGDHTRRVYLQIPNGGTWPAKCTVSLYGEHDRARIHSGWTELVQDNCLQVGDAIVFELMEQQPKVTLKIHVFRAQ